MPVLLDGVPWHASPPPAAANDALPSPVSVHAPSAGFAELFGEMTRAVDRGEALVARAPSAATGAVDVRMLIALQAGIYRYTEAVELIAKLVDRGTGAIRTVIQSGH